MPIAIVSAMSLLVQMNIMHECALDCAHIGSSLFSITTLLLFVTIPTPFLILSSD
jgi:hypothetical protein